jgi:cytoskeletal protein RodZ
MGAGAQLRRAREARGLTVRDVADTTKIPSRQIDAIESEHYEKLPGGIFGRGYVRAVAVALKLDADAIVEAYRDETEPERSALPVNAPAEGRDEHMRRTQVPQQVSMAWRVEQSELRMRLAPGDTIRRSPSRWLAAVLICIGAILLIFWLGRDRAVSPFSGGQPAAEPVAALDGIVRAPEASAPSRSTDLARPEASTPGTAAPVASAASAVDDQAVGTVGEGGSGAIAAPAGDGRPTDLLIVADRASWLVLTVDGTRIARRRLQPREAVHVQMRSRATLRTGDAGALRMSMNGGAFAPLGPSGAVRTVEVKAPGQ